MENDPTQDWDIPQDFSLMNNSLKATLRKLVAHVLIHEIRHWAQIATLCRFAGLRGEFHDFLFSPVLGAEGDELVVQRYGDGWGISWTKVVASPPTSD